MIKVVVLHSTINHTSDKRVESFTHACSWVPSRKPHRPAGHNQDHIWCRGAEAKDDKEPLSQKSVDKADRDKKDIYVSVPVSLLDPVRRSCDCFSFMAHSAPWGIFLALYVRSRILDAGGPGHILQYVENYLLCCGYWTLNKLIAIYLACLYCSKPARV